MGLVRSATNVVSLVKLVNDTELSAEETNKLPFTWGLISRWPVASWIMTGAVSCAESGELVEVLIAVTSVEVPVEEVVEEIVVEAVVEAAEVAAANVASVEVAVVEVGAAEGVKVSVSLTRTFALAVPLAEALVVTVVAR